MGLGNPSLDHLELLFPSPYFFLSFSLWCIFSGRSMQMAIHLFLFFFFFIAPLLSLCDLHSSLISSGYLFFFYPRLAIRGGRNETKTFAFWGESYLLWGRFRFTSARVTIDQSSSMDSFYHEHVLKNAHGDGLFPSSFFFLGWKIYVQSAMKWSISPLFVGTREKMLSE